MTLAEEFAAKQFHRNLPAQTMVGANWISLSQYQNRWHDTSLVASAGLGRFVPCFGIFAEAVRRTTQTRVVGTDGGFHPVEHARRQALPCAKCLPTCRIPRLIALML